MSRKTLYGWLASLAFLVVLTVVMLQVFGARRRAYVPEMVFVFPGRAENLAFMPPGNASQNARFLMVTDGNRWYEGDLVNGTISPFGKRAMMPGHFIITPHQEACIIRDGEFGRYDLKTTKRARTILAVAMDSSALPAAAISSDGNLALVSTYNKLENSWKNGALWLARTSDGKSLWREKLKADDAGNLPVVRGRAFSPDNKTFAVSKSYLGAVGRFPSRAKRKQATRNEAARNSLFLLPQHTDIELREVSDGKLLRKISAPDPDSFMERLVSGKHLSYGLNLAFSPNGKNLVVASTGIAQVFDTQTGAFQASLPRPKETHLMQEVAAMTFSPNGKLLAICRSDLIEIYND